MQTALLLAPLYSLGQDDQNAVQHDLSDYVTPLAPASAGHKGFVNSTITFLIS